MKRLVINACARKESNTYKIFEELVKQKNWNEDDYEIVNLYEENIPYLTEEMLEERVGGYKSREGMIEKRLVEQFENANQVIFIYPSWNWNVPAILKSYIDLITISDRTFTMKGLGTLGLTKISQAIIINTSGGPVLPKLFSYALNINTDLYYMKNMMGILGVDKTIKIRLGAFGYKYRDKEELLRNDITKIVKKNLYKIN